MEEEEEEEEEGRRDRSIVYEREGVKRGSKR